MESTPNSSGGQHWRATFADWQGAADRLGLKLQGGELKGPCPSCSGTDRFSVARSGVFQCRGCNPSSGNPEAVRAILGAAFPDSRRGPERQPRTWPYATAGGQSVTVHRADGPGGKKVWRIPKGVKGPFLPLYHDQLADGPLVIAEGETTADAIRAAGFDATTWQGGTAQLEKTDWSGIGDREVTLWPDNDGPGRKAMNRLAGILQSQGCTVRVVQVPDGKPKAWDAADANPAEIPALVDGALEWQPSAGPDPAAAPEGAIDDPLSEGHFARRWLSDHGESAWLFDGADWMHYHAGKWIPDTPAARDSMARVIRSEVAQLGGEGASLERAQKAFDNHRTVTGALNMCAYTRTVEPSTFDASPLIVAFPDGTVYDAATGRTRAATPGDRIRHTLAVSPADEPCELWGRFINELLAHYNAQDRPQVLRYYQAWLGTALIGDCRDEAAIFQWGQPGSGKSTAHETIMAVLGDTAAVLAGERLAGERRDHRQYLAGLVGKRFLLINELPDRGQWNDADLNGLIDGSPIEANRMRAASFRFNSQLSVMISGNSRPGAKGESGLWRRLRLVECRNQVDNPDPDLKQRLKQNLPGVLRWMLDGLAAWVQNGQRLPDTPQAIKAAVEEYRDSADGITQFINECTEPESQHEPEYGVTVAALYDRMADWWPENIGTKTPSKTALGKALRNRGWGHAMIGPKNARQRTWIGHRLKDAA